MRRGSGLAAGVAWAAAVVPIAVAAVRAIVRGWYPIGDNAFFSLRARDVLTEHHPLLGTWSSASLTSGTDVNNPGPLLYDWLALPAKLDHVNGVVVGSAALAIAAVTLLVVVARRRSEAAATACGAAAAALVWAMGSELVIEPWQPHSLLLPFLAYLVLVWGIAVGDVALLPWAVGLGSLLVQTHLTYGVVVPVLGVAATVAAVVVTRSQRPAARPAWRRHVVVAVVVAALAWAQPVADQVTGTGNLGDLAGSATGGAEGDPVGPVLGARLVASVVASPPWWARPSFEDTFMPVELQPPGPPDASRALVGVPSAAAAVGGLALLLATLAVAGWWARRRWDRVAAVGTVALTLVTGVATTSLLPVGPLGLGPHQLRWLWPLAVLTTAVLVLCVAPDRWTRRGAVVVAVGLGVAALPTHAPDTGPTVDAYAIDVVRALAPQLDSLPREEPLLVDLEGLPLFEPYSTPLMLELQVRGIDWEVDHRFTLRQVGRSRSDTGAAARTVRVVIGPDANEVAPGTERVAYVAGLDEEERAELRRSEDAVVALVERDGLDLTADGRRALELGLLPQLAAQLGSRERSAEPLILGGDLQEMVARGYLDVDADDRRRLERWAELRTRLFRETVAVVIEPRPAS
jgi:hypothetical protein